MNKLIITLFIVYGCMISCTSDIEDSSPGFGSETNYKPRLMTRDNLENSISLSGPETLYSPSKLYYKDGYLYISEKYKGVHVINNFDPSNPQAVAFINIPGCVDMAIKDNILYADNATDLVAINLSGIPNSISITKRVPYIFPEIIPPDSDEMPEAFTITTRPEKTVIVEWVKID